MKKRVIALVLALALTMGLTSGLVLAADESYPELKNGETISAVSGEAGEKYYFSFVCEDGYFSYTIRITAKWTGMMYLVLESDDDSIEIEDDYEFWVEMYEFSDRDLEEGDAVSAGWVVGDDFSAGTTYTGYVYFEDDSDVEFELTIDNGAETITVGTETTIVMEEYEDGYFSFTAPEDSLYILNVTLSDEEASLYIHTDVTYIGDENESGIWMGEAGETYHFRVEGSESEIECTVLVEEIEPSGTCGDNLTWTLSFDTLTISGTGNMYDYDYFTTTCPWYIYDECINEVVIEEGVTSIGKYAFYYCTSLAGVSLPSTMTSIGDNAFKYCTSLTGIEIPENCEVGDGVFIGCIGLADEDGFIIVENVLYTYAGTEADVVIPEGVTSIEDGAFTDYSVGNSMFGGIYVFSTFYTTSITSVSIPDSVTNIGNEVFAFCTSLEDIVVPSGVTTIGDSVFDWDISLESITFEGDAPELESYSDEYYGLGDGLKEGLTVYYYSDAAGWTDEYKTTLAGNADVIWVELDRESGEVVSTSDSGTSLSIIDSETTASYTLGSGGGAVITVDADIADFISVTVDGTVLTQDVDYTVTEGSTIITFTESFLETLTEGDHDVIITFTGGDVETILTILASGSSSDSDDADDSDESSAAEVGDSSDLTFWMVLSFLAAIGLACTGFRKRING